MGSSAVMRKRPPVRTGRMPLHRSVVASRMVEAPYDEVERSARFRLSHLVETASARGMTQSGNDLVARVHLRHWPERTWVPVVVEVESAYKSKPGVIAHLRWHAQRFQRVFPVMEADLFARPEPDGGCELVLVGTYFPPLGSLGIVGDVLVGHRVALSTAKSFLDELGQAIEADAVRARDLRLAPIETTTSEA